MGQLPFIAGPSSTPSTHRIVQQRLPIQVRTRECGPAGRPRSYVTSCLSRFPVTNSAQSLAGTCGLIPDAGGLPPLPVPERCAIMFRKALRSYFRLAQFQAKHLDTRPSFTGTELPPHRRGGKASTDSTRVHRAKTAKDVEG